MYLLPWFVVGPLLGLIVVVLYALANKPLGASGAYFQVISLLRRRADVEMWRVWYFVGLVLGALVAAALRGGPSLGFGYGALGRVLPLPALAALLLGAGILMGYGARWAGGCTSGHGLCGTSTLSPASFAVAGTFFVAAVSVTFVLQVLTGGAL